MRTLLFTIVLLCCLNVLFGQAIIDITEQCKFPDQRFFPQCMISSFELYDELVIKSEESFHNFFEELQEQRSWCDVDKLPFIDFSKYILLSKWSSGGGCKTDYKYKVTLDSLNKEIVYTVSVKYEGACEKFTISNNFVLVPVVPDDYRITCRLIEDYSSSPSSIKSPRVESLKQSSSIILEKIKALQDSLYQISMVISSLTNNDHFLRQRELELYGVSTYTAQNTTELYIDHDFKSEKVASIPPKSKVRVFDKYGYYLKAKYNGKTGWIKSGWIILHEDINRLDDKRNHSCY